MTIEAKFSEGMRKMSEDKKNGAMHWLHPLIMALLMVSGWFLPTFSTVTEFGVKVLGIFVGMMYGWIFIDLIWTSLLGMIMLSLCGLGTAVAVFGSGFGSEIVLLVIFFSVFTTWLEDIGLINTVTQWLLTRKVLKGRPYLFIFMIFLVTFICGAFVGIYATIFLMWGICYKLLLTLGYEKQGKMGAFLLIGVAYTSIMGMCVKPWTPWSMMGIRGLTTATGLNVDFLPYSSWMIVISIVSILLFLLVGKFIVRIDCDKMKNIDFAALGGTIDFNKQQKLAAFMLVAIILALYLPSALSKDLWIYAVLNQLGAVGVIGCVTIVLCMVSSNGKPILEFASVAAKAIPWSMVCLLASVGPIGTALMHADAGITKMVLSVMRPIFAGQSPMMIYILVSVICCVLTQFLNNTVLLVALTPLMCQLAQSLGANPVIVAVLMIFALSSALATPGASSRAGLVFGNTECTKEAYFQGILTVLCVLIALLFVGVPLGMMIL